MSFRDLVGRHAKRIGEAGRRAEKKTAKRVKGQLVLASGAMPSHKGDYRTHEFLVENKSTTQGSFSVKFAHLAKIVVEAQAKGLTPALTVQFTRDDGKPVTYGAWVLVPEWWWKEVTDARRSEE